ncbi:MAG: hypothetical protein E7K59_07380 [Clostridium perfringens]|nr:hypothetical protein [Clostridium perfringens]
MKKKSFFASLLTLGIAVLVSSNIAFAGSNTPDQVEYKIHLPTTGSEYTDPANKCTKADIAQNYCSYLGWKGSGINSWVVYGDSQLTKTVNYNSTGMVYMKYFSGYGSSYWGYDLKMQIKTDGSTWHPCDVKGYFNPAS